MCVCVCVCVGGGGGGGGGGGSLVPRLSFSEGRREPGNIGGGGGSNRGLPVRHHSCDKQRTLLLLW